MSMDPSTGQDALLAHARATFVGGRVYEEIPEEETLVKIDDVIQPYIVITFGMIYPLASDRTIEGEADQPHIQPWTAECWAADKRSSQRTANAVVAEFVGFVPDADCSEIKARNGGTFARTDSSGRPTRAMTPVQGEWIFNMSIAA